MKVIDLHIGRETAYGGTEERKAKPWVATLYSESVTGSIYPDERSIPAHIAEKMAQAAFDALKDSGFFEPMFDAIVVPLAKADLVVIDPGVPDKRSLTEAIVDSMADGGGA